MATSENVIEEFEDLGFTLDTPQIIDRLVRSIKNNYIFVQPKILI